MLSVNMGDIIKQRGSDRGYQTLTAISAYPRMTEELWRVQTFTDPRYPIDVQTLPDESGELDPCCLLFTIDKDDPTAFPVPPGIVKRHQMTVRKDAGNRPTMCIQVLAGGLWHIVLVSHAPSDLIHWEYLDNDHRKLRIKLLRGANRVE